MAAGIKENSAKAVDLAAAAVPRRTDHLKVLAPAKIRMRFGSSGT
jgi:hypothetical protein